MPHEIEEKARKILAERLRESGSNVRNSDKKTFDLIVNGKYGEIKSKNKKYSKIDFISLTDKQFQALKDQNFDIYLICNVEEDNNIEIYKFSAKSLIDKHPRKVRSYEYGKSIIDTIDKEKL